MTLIHLSNILASPLQFQLKVPKFILQMSYLNLIFQPFFLSFLVFSWDQAGNKTNSGGCRRCAVCCGHPWLARVTIGRIPNISQPSLKLIKVVLIIINNNQSISSLPHSHLPNPSPNHHNHHLLPPFPLPFPRHCSDDDNYYSYFHSQPS